MRENRKNELRTLIKELDDSVEAPNRLAMAPQNPDKIHIGVLSNALVRGSN